MLDFITKFFRREEASRDQAKERLRLVLMSDRVSLAPDLFDSMKNEMLGVVRRYLEIDERGLDVHFENAERQFLLLANIPVFNVRTVVGATAGNGANGSPLLLEGTPAGGRRRRRRRRKHQTEGMPAESGPAAHDAADDANQPTPPPAPPEHTGM